MKQKLNLFKNCFLGLKRKDLSKFILPTELENTDNHQQLRDEKFNTKDYIFINSVYEDVVSFHDAKDRILNPTDYAIANGADVLFDKKSNKGKTGTAAYWLRSAYSGLKVDNICRNGVYHRNFAEDAQLGIAPAMHLDLKAIIAAKKISKNFGKIAAVKDADGNVLYHTIEFGYYPKTRVNSNNIDTMALVATGKSYTGYLHQDRNGNYKYVENPEYKYSDNNYYVFTQVNPINNNANAHYSNFYADGVKVNSDYVFIRVEPITWVIKEKNWKQLPKALNPEGDGTAKYLDVRAENVIISGIPFAQDIMDDNATLWQNSPIRGFLNGICVGKQQDNINSEYPIQHGYDFSRLGGFLQEAFNISPERIKIMNQQVNKETNKKLTRFKNNPKNVMEKNI